MEVFQFDSLFFEVTALYVLNCILILRLFISMNFLAIVVWPIIIYSIGPYMSYAFLYAPFVSKYVFPENFLEETSLFTVFLVFLIFLDKIFHIGDIIRNYVLSKEILRLGSSRKMGFLFYISGVISATFQIALMAVNGSIFTGNYLAALPTQQTGNQSISWGMLGGFYEMFFSCTVLIFISKKNISIFSREAIFYSFVLLLRLLGGTRLIIIKELSVILFIMLYQKKVRIIFVSMFAILVVAAGTIVGVARTGGGSQEFGALSSFVYESTFTALTLNVADSLAHDQGAYQFYHPVPTLIDLTASLVPSFIRNVFVEEKSDREVNMATEAGFDTSSPVGAMALFASCIYIFYNPWVGPFLLPILLLIITKIKFSTKLKSYILVAIFIESLNMWRDPFEISLKVIVQAVVVYVLAGMDWTSLVRQMTRPKAAKPVKIFPVTG